MPTLPDVDHVLKVAVDGTLDDVPCTNLFHIAFSGGPPNVADLNSFAHSFYTAWSTRIMPNLTNQYEHIITNVTDLTTTSSAVGSYGQVSTGGSSGTPCGNQVCILVKHHIARRYRGGHPRTYLPPSSATNIALGQQWSGTFVTTMNTAYTNFISDVEAIAVPSVSGPSFVCVSYFSGGALRVTPLVQSITSSVVENTLATQRRRLGR